MWAITGTLTSPGLPHSEMGQTAISRSSIVGDVNGDCIVYIVELVLVARAFGSTPSSPNWNSAADIDKDGVINIVDLALVAAHLGQVCQSLVLQGSLYTNDSGQSHGGWEFVGVWNVTVTVNGTSGALRLACVCGGWPDQITKHDYAISDFQMNSTTISLKLDSSPLVLGFVQSDTIWNHAYDKYYIASWGQSAPPAEIRGTILPTYFPGLQTWYYVELRMR